MVSLARVGIDNYLFSMCSLKSILCRLAFALTLTLSLSNCAVPPPSANIIRGMPSGGAMPIYVMATYNDLKAGGLSAGWLRGWTQAEFEFLRLYPDRQICVRQTQTPACREQMPIGLVAVPKSYLTGEIPGSVALYQLMSGTGDLIGGAGSLLTGMAWFRGVKIGISGGGPLATSTAYADGGSASATGGSASATGGTSSSNSTSTSNSHSNSTSKSYSNSTSNANANSNSYSNSGSFSQPKSTYCPTPKGTYCPPPNSYLDCAPKGSGGSGSGGSGSGSGYGGPFGRVKY